MRKLQRSWTLGVVVLLLAAGRAGAFEWFDGRVELHGFYEMQVRSIVTDFEFSDGWDLTQWWNILNLEIEVDVAPDGVGPFDLITMYTRIEVRYDCVWTAGCTMFDSANAYRIGHDRRLPDRLTSGRRTGFSTNVYVGDRRRYPDVELGDIGTALPGNPVPPNGSRKPAEFWQTPLGGALFSELSAGPDAAIGTEDDIGFFLFDTYTKRYCNEWGVRDRPGSTDGRSSGESLPLNPACKFETRGEMSDKPNPFRPGDFNPIIGEGGRGAFPYRAAPEAAAGSKAPEYVPHGIYYPNARLQEMLRNDEFSHTTDTLRRAELAWNHGDSQQDQKELKELYFDMELFDSQLWIRAGYQTIVWGKTELFRNQDQFNPTDLALGSLTSLEESRISLWAIRMTWSLYDQGPFQDVRVELAANYDQYQGNDFGLCGEPYTPLAACALSTGKMAHGFTGLGIAGTVNPPDAWNSWSGIEAGGRLEWRWERFSFAISDYYGYLDSPVPTRLFSYSRNVDPVSGRPRHTETTDRCRSDGSGKGCLSSKNALLEHSANQELFGLTCAGTVGVVASLDPTACLASIFGSPARSAEEGVTSPRVVVAINMIASGDGIGDVGVVLPGLGGFTDTTTNQIRAHTYNGTGKVTVTLNRDVNDGPIDYTTNTPGGQALLNEADFGTTVDFFYTTLSGSISDKLTDQQEALLGCGAFYETSCDLDGVDLLNMEAGVIFQSFPIVSGTQNSKGESWDTTDASDAQPGTVGFRGEPVCTRFENGKAYILPGCRGPGDPGYDPRVDGTTTGLLHPFTGQQFKSELAALSWNVVAGLVGFFPAPETGVRIQDFDLNDAFRKDGCSFAAPQWCTGVRALFATSGVQRNSLEAGGNAMFGRRDFIWHSGGNLVLRTEKKNVLGFSADFAEDLTKSNWGFEFTWWDDAPAGNADEFDGLSEVDLYRLTISVDRPTFINFLNANRTFFINTQWFFEYRDGWNSGVGGDGPWNIFGVVAVATGYFQDRLLTSATFVYFVMNNSLAFLPQVSYRVTENFSLSVGVAAFAGRDRAERMPINSPAPVSNRFGRHAYDSFTEPGLSVIRERDEIYMRLRYTF